MSQRFSEWRSSFGSAAIAIVNAFFDDNDDYRDSDMMRQEFATHMLDKLRFVYRHNRGDDKKVSLYLLHDMQHTKHVLFRNSVASFATHSSCRLSLSTSMPFLVRDGSMDSMKKISRRSLVECSPWLLLRYAVIQIIDFLLIHS